MAKDHQQRAIRRHHLARLKAKRLDYYGGYARKLPRQERQLHVGKFAHTAKLCSCRGCGNPRQHEQELTMQERRFADQARLDGYGPEDKEGECDGA